MSAVDDYLQSNAAFESAKLEVKRLVSHLYDLANAVRDYPEEFYFSNSNVHVPMEIGLNRNAKSFDAKLWPDADAIQKAIVRRYEARKAATDSWSRIPKELRVSLVPPKN